MSRPWPGRLPMGWVTPTTLKEQGTKETYAESMGVRSVIDL